MAIQDKFHHVGFFAGMDKEDVDMINECSQRKHFSAGDIIYNQGDDANCFCIIQKGKVAIELSEPDKQPVQVQILESGDVFGLCWLYPPYACEYTARVLEDCVLVMYNAKKIQGYFIHNSVLRFEITRRFSLLLNNRLRAVRQVLMNHVPEQYQTPPEVFFG